MRASPSSLTLARQSRRQVKSCDRKQPRQHIDPIDGQSLGRRIDDFRNRDTTRRSIIRDLIPAHLVESRPVRGRRRIGKWGSLGQELNRKSLPFSIRRLVARYSDIPIALSPCHLMSPDSVARFIPPDSITLDIVVFDEVIADQGHRMLNVTVCLAFHERRSK